MNFERVRPVADAILYEGYALYPYRASSIKNRKRFNFGVLLPRGWPGAAGADTHEMRTECLVEGFADAVVRVAVRFLRLVEREGGKAGWHEAVEHEIGVPETPIVSLLTAPTRAEIRIAPDAATIGATEIAGTVSLAAEADPSGVFRVSVQILNETPLAAGDRETAMLHAFVSTHTIVQVHGAELVSLLEAPEALQGAVGRCRNVGTWPVLVGEPWERDMMLSSPIVLYDRPRVAAQSPGNLFDGTEIDEILTLRTLTLTDAEKAEAAAGDPRVREMLARTEALDPQTLAQLHGALRRHAPTRIAPGDRVRLQPKRRADILDIALAGKVATVTSLEADVDGDAFVCVTVDDDPGADLGRAGQAGHRFFFRIDEVEPLP